MVLETQFRSVKYTTVSRIRRNFDQLFILRQVMQASAVQWIDKNKPLQKVFERI